MRMCLKFADEYQAGNVVSQCLAEVRHDQSALSRLTEKIRSGASMEQLGKFVPELSDNKVAHDYLLTL